MKKTADLPLDPDIFDLFISADPSPVFVYETGTGLIQAVNQAAIDVYGYDKNDFTSMTFGSLSVPKAGAKNSRARQAASDWPQPNGISIHRRKNGSFITVRLSSVPIMYDGGQSCLVFSSFLSDAFSATEGLESLTLADSIVAASPEPILVINKDHTIAVANPGFYSLFAKTPAKTIGRSICDISSGIWNTPRLRSVLRSVLSGRAASADFQVAADFPRLGHRDMAVSVRRLSHDGRKLDLALVAFSDITDRLRIESILKENEAQFRTVAEATTAGIFVFQDDKVTYTNRSAAAMVGCSPGELVGRDFRNIAHRRNKDLHKSIGPVGKKGDPFSKHYEFKLTKKDGSDLILDYTICPIQWRDRPAVMGTAQDITDRVRMQRDLEANANFLKNVFSSIQDGICVLDNDLRIISINPVCADRHRRAARPLIGKKCYRSFYNRAKPCPGCPSVKAIETGRPASLETRDPGSGAWLEFNAYPLNDMSSGRTNGVIEYIRDLTDKKATERALEESDAVFRTLSETTTSAVVVIEQPADVVYFNGILSEVTGYTRSELKTKPLIAIVQSDYQDRIMKAIRAAFRSDRAGIKPLEFKYLHKDGSERWAYATSGPLSWKGRPALIANIVDITGLKETQAMVRANEELLMAFADATDDLACIKDADLRYIMVNKACASFLGRRRKDVLGSTDAELIPPEQAARGRKSDLKSLASKHPIMVEERLGNKIFETIKFPVALSEGRIGVGSLAREITAKKRDEEAIQEREQRYATLLKNLPGMVYRCLPDDKWTLTFVSGGCLALTGFKPENFIGNKKTSLSALILPEDLTAVRESANRSLARKRPFRGEYRIRTADGRIKWARNQVRGVFDLEGRMLFREGYIEDITARKEAEEKLTGLNRDLKRQLDEMRIVHEMSRNSFRLGSLEHLDRQIIERLKKIHNYDHIDIFALDKPTGRFIPVNSERWYDPAGRLDEQAMAADMKDISSNRLGLDKGITGRAAADARTVIVDDVQREPDYLASGDGMLSEICVPLKLPDGQVVGVINIESRTPAAFGDEDRRFLETISALVAASMDSFNLYKDASRRAAVFLAINKAVTGSDSARTDLPKFLEEVLGCILKAFDVRLGLVWFNKSVVELADWSVPYVALGLNTESAAVYERYLTAENPLSTGTVVDNSRRDMKEHAARQAARMNIEADIRILLKTSSERIGTLTIFSPQIRIWSSEEIALLEAMGDQLALVIEKAFLDTRIRRRLLELETINKVSAALRTAVTRDEMLPLLLDNTMEAMETGSGCIWLYDQEKNAIRSVASRGWFNELTVESLFLVDQGVGEKVLQTKSPIVLPDFAASPFIPYDKRKSLPAGWSGAVVPILSENDLWGGLVVSLPSPRQITRHEMKLVSSLAEMAGTALHRMRLLEETSKQLTTLQSLHAIDRAITSSLDLNQTLDFILQQIMSQLRSDATGILLFDSQRLVLEGAAGSGFRGELYKGCRIKPGGSGAGRIITEQETIRIDDLRKAGNFVRGDLISAEGFVAYAASPLIAKGELRGALELFFRSKPTFDHDWQFLFDTLAGQAAIAIDNAMMFSDLKRSHLALALSYDATIEGWAYALDLRDKETENHTRRVTEIALCLASEIGLSQDQMPHIRRGALLHDIGKMGVPDSVLLKPGALNEEEWVIMKRHPQTAYDMLSRIDYLKPAAEIPYCHHEKWDGSGYPRGLKGEDIPLTARIFAIADVYDALVSDRPYRPAWPQGKAIAYIREQSGRHFDPKVVEAFLRAIDKKEI